MKPSCTALKSIGVRFQSVSKVALHQEDSKPNVMHRVNDHFREAVDFYIYRLANTSSWYDDQVAHNMVKWAKCLQV